MTINQLRQYREILHRIKTEQLLLDELILKSAPFDSAGGNPYAVSDTVARIVVEREKTRNNINLLIAEKNAVEGYVEHCEPYYRTLLMWHYINGRTWAAISIKVGVTEDSLKKACHRYVRRNP